MRAGFRLSSFGPAILALGLLAGCSNNDVIDLSAKLGCGEVDGLGAIAGKKPPNYILIGETIETQEAPAAFAELACRIAARQPKDQPLWVGLPQYVGGSTDAERAMRKRLGDLVAKGAPMVLGDSTEGHTTGVSRREEGERLWAEDIMAHMKSAKAGRALLLLPRADGVAERVIDPDGRFSDYTPMALFLPGGEVMNLEIGQATNIGAPTIRIYTEMRDGYVGQIALGTVTLVEKTGPGHPPN